MREFEYDISKSLSNEVKHGISFDAAQNLWSDPEAITLKADEHGEIGYLLFAKLYNKHWSAIFTYRQLKIRIISVRRSRKNEVNVYESN
ncbi:BrnT family toxin [Paraglaciecola arctica]|uniref:Toxin n=1 Tax=Paraglaciecola arctica BSs20135 TaxID=493475 RepID=K6XE43_9ALTE|nr:BrnT family toxin [Paraglaciecola arctica]GAC18899.1 hypothetical protein GARC_1932 [Paraglaciecola arctica BSs20135]